MRLGPTGSEPPGFSAPFPDPSPLPAPGGVSGIPQPPSGAIILTGATRNGQSGVSHAVIGKQPFHRSGHQREAQHSGRGPTGMVMTV